MRISDIGKSTDLPIAEKSKRISDIGISNFLYRLISWFTDIVKSFGITDIGKSNIGKSVDFLISDNHAELSISQIRISNIGKSADFPTSEIRFSDIGNSNFRYW